MMQGDWELEEISRRRDELKITLLRAQSVVIECKAELADLEQRLERGEGLSALGERQSSAAARAAARSARPRKPRTAAEPIGPQADAMALTPRSRTVDSGGRARRRRKVVS